MTISRLWLRARELYATAALQLGARVLTLYSVLAAAAGLEILGFLAVWPLTIVGVAIAAVAVTVIRRRRTRELQ